MTMKRWRIASEEGPLNILAPSEEAARGLIFGLEGHEGEQLMLVDDGPVFKVSVWVESTEMRGGAYVTVIQQGLTWAIALTKAIENVKLMVSNDEDATVIETDYEMEEVS